jgi:hypothetical protein
MERPWVVRLPKGCMRSQDLQEEFTKMKEPTGRITLPSGFQARVSDESLVDSLERNVVREYDSMAFPQMIV